MVPFVQFKTVKNTHGGVLILVKLKAFACNFTKINTPPWVFFTFLNCTNGTKLRNALHMPNRKTSKAYAEPCQISKIEHFAKISNGFKPLTIFAKHSSLDV